MIIKLVTFAFVSTVGSVGILSSSEALEIGSGSDRGYPTTMFAASPKARDDNPTSSKDTGKDTGPVQVSKASGGKEPPGQLQQQLLAKEKEIAILRGKTAAAADLLNFEKNRAGALETQLAQLQQELKALRSRGQSHDQLSQDLAVTRSSLDQARQKIVDLDRQLATSNLEHAKRRIAELDRQLDAKDKEIMAMRTDGDSKEKLKDDLASRTEELKQANQHNLALEHEAIRAKATLDKVNRMFTDLETQLTTRNTELEQAKQLLANPQPGKAKKREIPLPQGPAVADKDLPRPAAVESDQPTTSKEQPNLVQSGGPEASGSDLVRLSDNLANELHTEINSGDVLLRQVGNKLNVELVTGELFAPGHVVMTQRGSSLLQRIGTVLQQFRYQTVEVTGHTDNTPIRNEYRQTFQDNSRLSWARAQQASRALIGGGLQADRVTAVGYAATKPIATNDTDEGRSKNRRVAITITQWSEPNEDLRDTTTRVSKKQQMFSSQKVVHR
jgi:chemotaxis protein MotB